MHILTSLGYYRKKHTSCFGFTLAEVLITLTIIGVIASLTIPDLITSVQTQQYSATLKKNYAVLSEATKNLQETYETINTTSNINLKDDYKKVLISIKQSDALDTDLYPQFLNYYKGDFGADNGALASMLVLSDGTVLMFWGDPSNCTTTSGSIMTSCGTIGVDVNGKKIPNMIGVDYFEFELYKSNNSYVLIPQGNQTGGTCEAGSSSWATSLGCSQNVILGNELP